MNVLLCTVLDKLNKINVNKCQGPDEIHGKLLFEIRHELVKPLTKLFNLSLQTSRPIVPGTTRLERCECMPIVGQQS